MGNFGACHVVLMVAQKIDRRTSGYLGSHTYATHAHKPKRIFTSKNMATHVSGDITALLSARSKWRGTVQLAASVLERIEVVRNEIQAGEDTNGWKNIGGWRNGGAGAGAGAGGGRSRFDADVRPVSRFAGAGHSNSQESYRRFNSRAPARAAQPAVSDSIPKFYRSAPVPAPAPSGKSAPAAAPAPTYTRYVSKFKNTEDSVENVVVNNIIQGKLNKFSSSNYNEIKEFLQEILGAGECDFLGDFMRLIFQKAAMEPTFCPLYAKLLFELSSQFPFLRTEMNRLYTAFLKIFEEVSDVGTENMEAFIQKNKEKKYRLGYSQFLAELYQYDIIDKEELLSTLRIIFDQLMILSRSAEQTATVDEYADCVARMLNVLAANAESFSRIREAIRILAAPTVEILTVKSSERPGLTNKTRFAMMDTARVYGGVTS